MLGQQALDLFHERQPHRRLNLGTIVRLVELSSVLGRLSSGLPLEVRSKMLSVSQAPSATSWPIEEPASSPAFDLPSAFDSQHSIFDIPFPCP